MTTKQRCFTGFQKSIVAACAALAFSAPAAAVDRALLIGVSVMKNWPVSRHLEGPMHDIPVIKQLAIKQMKYKPQNVRTLEYQEATYANIQKGLRELVAQTKPGDRVFLYYTGHGVQLRDDNGDEDDGLDEAIVPYDSASTKPFINFMRDDEIGNILQQLKGRDVLFVVDSCHSGTMTRDLVIVGDNDKPKKQKHRYIPALEAAAPVPPAATRSISQRLTADLAEIPREVTLIAAAQPYQKALDLIDENLVMSFDGKPHGLLTDAMMRGMMRAEADINGDGVITNWELRSFLVQSVISRNGDQEPSYEVQPERLQKPMMRDLVIESSAPIKEPVITPEPMRIAFEPGFSTEILKRRLSEAVPSQYLSFVGINENPEFAFRSNGTDVQLVKNSGQIYATLKLSGLLANQIDPLVVTTVRQQALAKPLLDLGKGASRAVTQTGRFGVQLDAPDGRYLFEEGEKLKFRVQSERPAYLLLLDVTQTGEINVLLPNAIDKVLRAEGGTDVFIPGPDADITVVPPFGIDRLKLFAFQTKPDWLDELIPKGGSHYRTFDVSSPEADTLLRNLRSWLGSHKDWSEYSIAVETAGKRKRPQNTGF